MDEGVFKKRIARIRGQIQERGLDGLVVTSPDNVRYCTLFSGHDSWALVTARGVYLLTDSRYTEQARGECAGCKILERRKALAEVLGDTANRQRSIDVLGVENSCTLGIHKALKKAVRARIKVVPGLINGVREVKEAGESRAVERAADLAWQSLTAALASVRAGMTESELAARIDYEIGIRGSVKSFDTIVAFGPNGSRPHHQPGKRRLGKKDTILIDFGAKYGGYCSDLTRCFVFGGASKAYENAWRTVLEAQKAAISMIRPGAELRTADEAAREVIRKAGLPVYGHGTGHGLGLEVHEGPVVSGRAKGTFEVGHIVTVEPGVYLPGKFGIRIEDDVLVTARGCKLLSGQKRYGYHQDTIPLLKGQAK